MTVILNNVLWHPTHCYCPACRANDNTRQRRLTFVLSTILAGALWVLWNEVQKH